jgi:hypothetical protein
MRGKWISDTITPNHLSHTNQNQNLPGAFFFSDRIDRILLLISHLPDEGEKTKSALRK